MKTIKILGIIFIALSLALVSAGCDMGDSVFNGEETAFDLDGSYSSDNFSFSYPEGWHIEQENTSDERHLVQIIDQEIYEDAEHFLWVYYSIDYEDNYYETKEEFYAYVDNVLYDLEDNPEIDVLYSSQSSLDDRPAHRIRYNLEDDYIFDWYLAYENQQRHNIMYYTIYGEFNINIADAFFDSFEFK